MTRVTFLSLQPIAHHPRLVQFIHFLLVKSVFQALLDGCSPWDSTLSVSYVVAFCHDDLLVQIQLVLSHHAHGCEVRIDDGHMEDSIEAVDPQISLFHSWGEKQEVSPVRFQFETVFPRCFSTINFSNSSDSLYANNLTFQDGLVFFRYRLLLQLDKVLLIRDDYVALVEV